MYGMLPVGMYLYRYYMYLHTVLYARLFQCVDGMPFPVEECGALGKVFPNYQLYS